MSVIDKVENSLKELALRDVDKCFRGGAKVGAFILLGCLIDAAGFWRGKDTTRTDYDRTIQGITRSHIVRYCEVRRGDSSDLKAFLRD